MESNSAAEVIDDAINDSKMPELELPKESVFMSKDKERDARYYKYDKTGKLISVEYAAKPEKNEYYAYDRQGNIIEKRMGDKVYKYTYDTGNQLKEMSSPEGKREYFYDRAGRLVSEKLNGEIDVEYKYGYLDKVIEVNRRGKITKFAYDGFGMLAQKTFHDGSTEVWVWDGLALIRRGSDIYVNEPHVSGGVPILSKTDEGVRYHEHDFLGTTLWSTDTKGNLVKDYQDTTIFGEGSIQHDRSARFTGKPYDEDLQAYVFPHRNYDASTARWRSSDPAGYPDGINNQFYAAVLTLVIDSLGLATLEVYGRPLSGSPAGTHTYGVLTVNSNEYSQLTSDQKSKFNSNSDGTYSLSIGGYKSDSIVPNLNSPADMGYYIDLTYNNTADSGGIKGGNVTGADGSINLNMNFVNAYLNAADNFNSNETSSLYSAIPLSSEFGNCNSLLSQLIEIAGGNFDASKLPWDAIGWSHRMKSNLFEK